MWMMRAALPPAIFCLDGSIECSSIAHSSYAVSGSKPHGGGSTGHSKKMWALSIVKESGTKTTSQDIVPDMIVLSADLQVTLNDLQDKDTTLADFNEKIADLIIDDAEYDEELTAALEYRDKIHNIMSRVRYHLNSIPRPTDSNAPVVTTAASPKESPLKEVPYCRCPEKNAIEGVRLEQANYGVAVKDLQEVCRHTAHVDERIDSLLAIAT
ncbi:hypothetical protein HPB51_006856 [Rhipicephalus microplus]|uniref:Uncharacterized protein n=1 Tax=Rhipicephalus microplus TaxID=6941 RepID=A0A9J6E8H6_RHIMP|nr:hypothetical protein HPB51_006856 [Rhipicephalus microplus]